MGFCGAPGAIPVQPLSLSLSLFHLSWGWVHVMMHPKGLWNRFSAVHLGLFLFNPSGVVPLS